MAEKPVEIQYKAGEIVTQTAPAVINEAGEEVSIHAVLAEIRNDVRLLVKKLVEE